MVANTKQPEIDYQLTNGTNVETHYAGDGGVQLSNFFDQAMFAIRFSDLNLLISNQITNKSRLMFDRGVQARVSKAAPFLSLDADPVSRSCSTGRSTGSRTPTPPPTTTPTAQNADTSALPAGSGLNQNFNYVRNSVKVLINAYTGKMTFYVMDPQDPIIQTYEKAFPGMFTPASKMSADLRAHLRYPEDIFTVQATMYGKYHITNAQSFYSAADAWALSPSPGRARPSQALQTTLTTNAQGEEVSTGQLVRMAPIYQVLQVPGQTQQSFNLLDAFVPVSGQSQIQTLSGFMIAGSDPGHYGQLRDVRDPAGQPGRRPGHRGGQDRRHPGGVPADLPAQPERILGALGQCPDDPGGQFAALHPAAVRGVVAQRLPRAAAGHRRLRESAGGHRHDAGGAPCTRYLRRRCPPPRASTSRPAGSSPQVRALLDEAQQAYQQSQTDLKAGNLGAYQTDIKTLESNLQEVQQLTGGTSATDHSVDHHHDHPRRPADAAGHSGRPERLGAVGSTAPLDGTRRPDGNFCCSRRGVEQSGSSSGS